MKKMMIAFSALGLVFLTSCGGKSEAVEATDAKDTAEASAEAKTFYVDNVVSNVNWRGYKFYEETGEEGGHNGFIKLASGEVSAKGSQLESGNFVIDVATIESMDLGEEDGKADLDSHLRNEDFMHIEKYPTATFEITNVTAIDSTDFNSLIEGNLKLRETPKNITFKANVEVTEEGVTIKSEDFEINRKDFGVVYPGGHGALIKDNVGIQIDVTATANKPEEVEGEPAEEPATEEAATEEVHS